MKKFISSILMLGLLVAPISSMCFADETETFVVETPESVSDVNVEDDFLQKRNLELKQKLNQDSLELKEMKLANDSLKGQNKSGGNLEETFNFEKKANNDKVNESMPTEKEKTFSNFKAQDDVQEISEKIKQKESVFSQMKAKLVSPIDQDTKDQLKKAAQIGSTVALTIGVPLAFKYFTDIHPEKVKKKYNACYDDVAEVCKKLISTGVEDLLKAKNNFAECKSFLVTQTCKEEYNAKERADKLSKFLTVGKILIEILKIIVSA